ncbi:transformer-2 sex-determining protein-like isoform X1 [Teleopsis dalmanni]|uniref:transformer-2 sex-determining protein-like isoform X1 n=1 Tax=Teleopsis dalmanni TaxID=139649 RepID=UPI0018CD3C68|nr:transformer-2 sex-determining protein-like isoform X1 [Teleopsis dalmanni]
MSFKLSSISTESGASSSSKLSKNYPKTVKYRSGHHHHRHRYEEPKHERIVRRSSSESSTLSKSSSNVSYRCVTTVGKSFVSRCIGVFGMNIFTKKKYIFELFSKFGPIENFNFITDARTGLFRGFCFIYYISTDDAKLAKKTLNGIDIDGRKIRVDYSFTQRPHSPTPGLYMGRCTKQLNSLLFLVTLNQLVIRIQSIIVLNVIAAAAVVVILHKYANFLIDTHIVIATDIEDAQEVDHKQ